MYRDTKSIKVQGQTGQPVEPVEPVRCETQGICTGSETPSQASDKGKESTTIMVDQLWMWILGDQLIVACGAQRWDATRSDFGTFRRLKDCAPDLSQGSSAESSGLKATDVAKKFLTACFGTFDRHARGMTCLQVREHVRAVPWRHRVHGQRPVGKTLRLSVWMLT